MYRKFGLIPINSYTCITGWQRKKKKKNHKKKHVTALILNQTYDKKQETFFFFGLTVPRWRHFRQNHFSGQFSKCFYVFSKICQMASVWNVILQRFFTPLTRKHFGWNNWYSYHLCSKSALRTSFYLIILIITNVVPSLYQWCMPAFRYKLNWLSK